MGMQGLAYMHSDLGGFAGSNDEPELYTRWLQYGVFQPVYRPHAQEDVPSEPIFKDSKTKALTKKAIELRYQLLPYNYTLAFDNNQKGFPLMRPLLFEEPSSKKMETVSETYLWGNEFLIHPIVKPGQKKAQIYFPKTNNWFDFYSNEKHVGGETKEIKVVENHIPTFVRGGAFVPMIKTIQTTDSYSIKNIDLHFYHDISVEKSAGKLYHDDGYTREAFEKGQYEILNFESIYKKDKIKISIDTEVGDSYMTTDKEIQFIDLYI
jgi:alpha-glucosidase (family GH31 glycosyl hydrolase)